MNPRQRFQENSCQHRYSLCKWYTLIEPEDQNCEVHNNSIPHIHAKEDSLKLKGGYKLYKAKAFYTTRESTKLDPVFCTSPKLPGLIVFHLEHPFLA